MIYKANFASLDEYNIFCVFFCIHVVASEEGGCSFAYTLCDDNAECTEAENGTAICTCKPDYQGDGRKGDNYTGCRLRKTYSNLEAINDIPWMCGCLVY
jgi:hypothetical protein